MIYHVARLATMNKISSNSPFPSLSSIRRFAAERSSNTATRQRSNQSFDGSIASQTTDNQCTKEIDDVESGDEEGLSVTAHPSLDTAVNAMIPASRFVELLFRQHGSYLDLNSNAEQSREGIGEVTNAEGADKRTEVSEQWYGGGNHECESPVHRYEDYPDEFASLGGKRREMEELHQNIAVDDLDADVAVERGSDHSTNDGQDVSSSLETV